MDFIWMNILSGREPSLHGTHTSLSTVQTQPCHASGTECPTCRWLLPPAPGSWGCTAAASCLALKNEILQQEVTVAQEKRSHVPAVAQEEALGTALPQAQPATLGEGGASALSFCVCRLPGWFAQL